MRLLALFYRSGSRSRPLRRPFEAPARAHRLAWLCCLAASSACSGRAEPPGAAAAPSSVSPGREVGTSGDVEPASSSQPRARGKRGKRDADASNAPRAEGQADAALGGMLDNLPFDETGKDVIKVASIAWRTWVYTDTGPTRTRYGYLRAGAVVAARGPKIVNEGCDGGWYRVNPRGFVCLGLGASTDLMHPVVQASVGRPVRGEGLPYVYALSSDTPPFLYFRLPSMQQMRESEGDEITTRAANFRARIKASGLLSALGEVGEPPDFLKDDNKLPKPYGVKQLLRYAYHAGQAAPDSGFAISKVFDHENRLFGLSTELDVIALDRLKLVRQSAFHGVEIGPDEGLPVAFAKEHYGQRFNRVGSDFMAGPVMGDREGVKLTGQSKIGYLETRDGNWVLGSSMRVLAPRDSFPSFATGDRKWIDISIKQQSLVAYTGKTPVYATLISSGRAGLGDPDKTESTPRGTFMVYQKEVASTMDGDEDKGDSYNLRDVPFVQYFHKGYALHGAYWHDEFGKVRSHGCVNLAPRDAAWLFEWTDPSVPKDWHGVLNKERGTVVYIHP